MKKKYSAAFMCLCLLAGASPTIVMAEGMMMEASFDASVSNKTVVTDGVIEEDAVWDEPTVLTGSLTVNDGVTLTIGSQVTISGEVTILGGGMIKRSESYKGALLIIPDGASLVLSDVTIDGGATWSEGVPSGLTAEESAIRVNGGALTLNSGAVVQNNNHTSIEDNEYNHTYYKDATGVKKDLPRYYNIGGGISIYGGSLTMNDGSAVKLNAVTNANYKKKTVAVDGIQTGNSDSCGGGIGIYENGTFTMNGGVISENCARVSEGVGRAYGGGVGMITRGKNEQVPTTPDDNKIIFKMKSGAIEGNNSQYDGGGVYGAVDQGDDESAKHTHLEMSVAGKVTKNTSKGMGGGIASGSADVKIENGACVDSNVGSAGGGIRVGSASHFSMAGGSVSNNRAIGPNNSLGGGIYIASNNNGTQVISGGTIADNSANGAGGGLSLQTDLKLSISDCTITGNMCGEEGSRDVANGGGVNVNPGATLELNNCQITGNKTKSGHGGGVYISGDHDLNVGGLTLSKRVVISENESALSGPNTYVNKLDNSITLNDLLSDSNIGVTWNPSNLNEDNSKVVAGMTLENEKCLNLQTDGDYLLRRDAQSETGVLHKALVLTLHFNTPGYENSPLPDEQTYKVLGITGDTVNFTDLCGFELEGYHIDRWATNRVGQEGYLWNNPYTFSDSFADDVQRGGPNAIWKANTYGISYELNGGTQGDSAPSEFVYDEKTELPTPSREGYSFVGWYSDPSFSEGSKIESLDPKTHANNLTLYAKWLANSYVIKFDANGGTGQMEDIKATYDTPATLPGNTFIKSGKKFAGWATTQDKANSCTVEYSNGSDALNLTDSGEVTLYAVWTDKEVFKPELTDTVVTYDGSQKGFQIDEGYTVDYYLNREKVDKPIAAGTYDIVISREEDAEHAAYHARVSAGLVIKKATLAVRADDKSMYVNGELPKFTCSVDGLKGSDTLDSIGLTVSASCDADGKTVGNFDIVAEVEGNPENYSVKKEKGTLTVSHRPVAPSDKIEVEHNQDGSTTTTVTKPDGSQTITHETATGTESVVKKDSEGNVTSTEVSVSKQDAESGKVELPIGKAEPAADADKAQAVEVKVPSTVTDDKPIQVMVPVAKGEGEGPDYGIVVFAVEEDGNETVLPKCAVDKDGNVVFQVTGDVAIKVVDAAKEMPDVTEADWFAGGVVDFVTARGIVNGVALPDGSRVFDGYGKTSRGMFVAMLHNLEVNPEAAGEDSLADVPSDAFYADAAAWALEEGILSGVDMPDGTKQFQGDADVTREQVAVFLMRYAQYLGMDVSARAEIDFPDAGEVSGFAKEAMSWAVAEGLFKGDDATGELNPTDGAARAEVAAVLMRFINLMYV